MHSWHNDMDRALIEPCPSYMLYHFLNSATIVKSCDSRTIYTRRSGIKQKLSVYSFRNRANSSLTKRNPLTETGNFGKEKPPLWLYPYTAEYIVLGQHLLLLYKKLFTFRYLQIQTILRQPH